MAKQRVWTASTHLAGGSSRWWRSAVALALTVASIGFDALGAPPASASPAPSDPIAGSPTTSAPAPLLAQAAGTPAVVTVEPARLLETRPGEITVDNQQQGNGPIPAGTHIEIPIAGRNGIPTDLDGAIFNLTAVTPDAPGFITIYPCGTRPNASHLNYGPDTVVANNVVAQLSPTGTICAWTLATTHLLIDLVAYTPTPTAEPPIAAGTLAAPSPVEGWRADPAVVLFDGSDDEVTITLAEAAGGADTGAALPAGTTLLRSSPVFDIAINDDGTITVGGGDTLGAELVAVQIPGVDEPVTFWVHSYRLQDGVDVIDPNLVVLPPADGTVVSTTDPFTESEIVARYDAAPTDGSQPFFPVVVRGAGPATGSRIVARDIFGDVIEPAGRGPITRDGLTLFTVRLTSLDGVFNELDVDLDYDELHADGVLTSEAIASDDESSGVSIGGFAERTRRAASPCEAGGSIGLGELKASGGLEFDPRGELVIFKTLDEDIQGLELTAGMSGTATAGLAGKVVLSAKASVTCKVLDIGEANIPVPPPVAAVLSGVTDLSLVGLAEADINPGFEANAGLTCSATLDVGIKVTWDRDAGAGVANDSMTPSFGCSPSWGLQGVQAGDLGPAIEGEAKGGVFLRAEAGLQVGGKITDFIGDIFLYDDLGEIKPFIADVGPRLDMVVETIGNVFVDQGSKTSLSLKQVFTMGLDKQGIDNALSYVFGFPVDVPVPVFEFTSTIADIIAPPSSGGASVIVNGVVQNSQTAEAELDDEVEIQFSMPRSTGGLLTATDATVGYIYDISVNPPVFVDYLPPLVELTGTVLSTSFRMTRERCDEQFNTRQTYRAVGYADIAGIPAIPGYAADFTLDCENTVGFALPGENPDNPPGSRDVPINADTSPRNVSLKHIGYPGEPFSLELFDPPPAPITLTIDPQEGIFTESSIDITITLECGDDVEAEGTSIVRVTAGDGNVLRDSVLTIEWSCKPQWITASPLEITVGGVITIESDGDEADLWIGGGSAAGLLSTVSEALPAKARVTRNVWTSDPRPEPKCKETQDEEIRNVTFTTENRGNSETVSVRLPERSGPPRCRPGGGGPGPAPRGEGGCRACGDPHIESFDGLRYDAQVLGDYVYAQSEGASFRLVGRHRSVLPDPQASFGATVVEALSAAAGGAVIEFYATETGLDLLVDGVSTEIELGQRLELDGGWSLVNVGRGIELRGESVILRAVYDAGFGGLIDTEFDVEPELPVTGLLGSNDSDATNDLRLSTGGDITLEQARAHGADLVRFTESWRIVDETFTPFTRTSPTFLADNPERPDASVLDPYRQAVLTELAGLNAICDGTLTTDDFLVEQLAFELAVGNDLETVLDLACSYTVSGTVDTPGPDSTSIPVDGATVIVDGDGFQPCSVTTLADGSWACALVPDLDEVGDGSGVTFPISITAAATPNGGSTATTTAVTIPVAAPFGDRAAVTDVDVTLPEGSIPMIDLSGTIRYAGAFITSPTSFDVLYRRASGSILGSTTLTVEPDGAGAYSARWVVPVDAAEVDIVWDQPDETPSANPSITVAPTGGIDAVDFSPHYDPPVVALSGQVRVNGEPPRQVRIVVEAEQGDGSTVTFEQFERPDETGSYGDAIGVPLDTVAVVVSVSPSGDDISPATGTIDPLTPGSTPLVVDLILDVPVLDLVGSAQSNGEPVVRSFDLRIDGTRTGGADFTDVVRLSPNADGSFARSVPLPDGTTAVDLEAVFGPIGERPTTTVSGLVDGANRVVFDAVATFPVLAIDGTSTAGGLPSGDAFFLDIDLPGAAIGSTTRYVDPAADGTFDLEINLAGDATSASITARTGFSESDWTTTAVPTLIDGRNAATVDPAFDAMIIELSGRITEDGTPVTDEVEIDIEARDAGGVKVHDDLLDVIPDAAGDYVELFAIPPASATIDVATRMSEFSVGRSWITFSGLTAGSVNEIAFNPDHDPPTLDLSGLFIANGDPFTGVRDLVVDIEYFDPRFGSTGTTSVTEPIYLSVIDGSYSTSVVLPDAAVSLVATAEVGPDPAEYPTVTVDPVLDGPNTFDLSADFDEPVRVAVSAALTSDGGPFTADTEFTYRAFDGNGVRIVDPVTIDAEPDVAGLWSTDLELPSDVRSVDIAWRATDGPVFDTFLVNPGDNDIDLDLDALPVSVDLTGTLLVDGSPFVGDATIELFFRKSRTGSGLQRIDVDVTTDSSGFFSLVQEHPATATYVEIEWEEGSQREGFYVSSGPNDLSVEFDDITYGPQTIEIAGTAHIGDDPWPDDIPITFRPVRLSGSSFPVNFTATPDPTTGAFAFTWPATTTVRGPIRVFASSVSFDETIDVDIAPSGTSILPIDIDVSGRRADVTGSVLVDGSAPSGATMSLISTDGRLIGTSFVTPDAGDGSITTALRTSQDAATAFFAVETGSFANDRILIGPERTLENGITSFSDVDIDLTTTTVDVSGTIEIDGAPRTDPFDLEVAWFDDDGFLQGVADEWTSTATATPDGSGTYSVSVVGPFRADRAIVTALLPAADLERTVIVPGLTSGPNPVSLDLDTASQVLRLDGSILDDGVAPFFAVPVTIEAIAGGQVIASDEIEVSVDGGDGSFSRLITLTDQATSVRLIANLQELAWWRDGHPGLLFERSDILDVDADTSVSWDVRTTIVSVSGSVVTSAGRPRADESTGLTITTRDAGGAGLSSELLDLFVQFDGSYDYSDYVEEDATSFDFDVNFDGVDPVTFTGVVPGVTTFFTQDFVTDPFEFVNFTGTVSVDGANPPPFSGVQDEVETFQYRDQVGIGSEFGDRLFGQRSGRGLDFNYVADDGTGFTTVLVPPEADGINVEVYLFAGTGELHQRTFEFDGQTSPYDFILDIDDTPNQLLVSGRAVTESPTSTPCIVEGRPFVFEATVLGYVGDPADGATPPPTEVLRTIIEPDPFNGDNYDFVATIPENVTHVEVEYDTSTVAYPQNADLTTTSGSVVHEGGQIAITQDLVAICTP